MKLDVTGPLYLMAKVLAWAAFHSWFRLRTRGVEKAPRKGPLIVASNHVSGLDPIIIGLSLRQRIYFLARETLLRGFPGWIMQVAGARPIRRDAADRNAIRTALGFLSDGKTIAMFPEGTRSRDGRVQPVRSGIGMISCRADCPILPVYIGGADRILPRGRYFPRPGPVVFLTGPLIRPASLPEGDSARERYDEIARRVHESLLDLERKARNDPGNSASS
jgi:1-acyl-sn-glycerol-3-phosphate acyltransferase